MIGDNATDADKRIIKPLTSVSKVSVIPPKANCRSPASRVSFSMNWPRRDETGGHNIRLCKLGHGGASYEGVG